MTKQKNISAIAVVVACFVYLLILSKAYAVLPETNGKLKLSALSFLVWLVRNFCTMDGVCLSVKFKGHFEVVQQRSFTLVREIGAIIQSLAFAIWTSRLSPFCRRLTLSYG